MHKAARSDTCGMSQTDFPSILRDQPGGRLVAPRPTTAATAIECFELSHITMLQISFYGWPGRWITGLTVLITLGTPAAMRQGPCATFTAAKSRAREAATPPCGAIHCGKKSWLGIALGNGVRSAGQATGTSPTSTS